jgi:hypothetical protein
MQSECWECFFRFLREVWDSSSTHHDSLTIHNSMTTQSDESEQDLALLNEDNSIRVIINETHEKFLSKDWLIEDGRASNSVLAMQVLGTKEGLQGTAVLTVDEEFVPVFDMLLLWISMGDQYLESNLTEENASALNGLAQYFGLEQLEQAIEAEHRKREQKHLEKAMKDPLRQRFNLARSRCDVRCFACGDWTTMAPTYRGDTPRCFDCREEAGHGNDRDEDIPDVFYDYSHYGYEAFLPFW